MNIITTEFPDVYKDAIFRYYVDNFYSPEHESGIKFDDNILKLIGN